MASATPARASTAWTRAKTTINSNTVWHNRYGLWIENLQPFNYGILWTSNSIFQNDGGLGIVFYNPPTIPPAPFR